MPGVLDLVGKWQNARGESAIGQGLSIPNLRRLPSGILAFDIASGGGIPMNRMTMIYGAESSGKTNLALELLLQHQRRYPDKLCVYQDIEGTLDEPWARKLGVDWDRMVLSRPDYAEEAVEEQRELLLAPDCGLIVTDSIAMLATMQEMEADADAERPGTQGRAVGKLVRHTTAALKRAEKDGYCPTLVWINQTRQTIGGMPGRPQGPSIPGGNAHRFMASMRVRVWGSNVLDEGVSKAMPVRKRTTGVIEKWKCPIIETGFKYEMVTVPHRGRRHGQCNDWTTALQYAVELGIWEDRGAKARGNRYALDGQDFRTQVEAWEWLQEGGRLEGFRERVVAHYMAKLDAGLKNPRKKATKKKTAKKKASS